MTQIALIIGSILLLGSLSVIVMAFIMSGTYFGSIDFDFFLPFILIFIVGVALFVKGYLGIAKNKQPKV